MRELLGARVHAEISHANGLDVATGTVGLEEPLEGGEEVALANHGHGEELATAMIDKN